MAAIGRRSVQEQNLDCLKRIRAVALSYEADPLRFSWLIEILQAKLLSSQQGILASLSQCPEQSGELYEGLWLTHQGQFFEFSVLVPRNGAELELEHWEEVTAETIVNAHQPGTGKSFGYLALEVLREHQRG